MMTRTGREAFTLIEVLVVITIIGMLAALLLPAVQQARESARRAECTNNAKQIGLAIQSFEGTHNRFPGWRNHLGYTDSGFPVKASWMFMILPQLERNDLHRTYTNKNAADGGRFGQRPSERLNVAICPSDPPTANSGTELSYAVNAGTPDAIEHPAYCVNYPIDDSANGVFHDIDPFLSYQKEGEKPKKRTVFLRRPKISAHDGEATTLLLAERVEARNWIDIGWTNPWDVNEETLGEQFTGITWMPMSFEELEPPQSDYLINGIKPPSPTTSSGGYMFRDVRPSSYHSGGVVVCFVDGHVTFLNEQIPYYVYQHLMTPDGARARNMYVNLPEGMLLRERGYTALLTPFDTSALEQ